MAELGFFRQAAADPERVALVAPDGTEVTARRLAARANEVSNGLRALGVERGDTFAVVVPNGIEMMELVLGAQQIGLYLTPINHHLVGPEIAYIVSDSDAKILVGHERFARALAVAAEEANVPEYRRFAIGSIPGWRAYSELTDGQPDSRPDNRKAGAPMHYTSGTTGRPKGVKRALADIDPDEMGALYSMFLMMFGVQPEDGNVHITGSPLVPHSGPVVDDELAALGPQSRAHGQVVTRGDAAAHRPAPGHDIAHGADAVPSPARVARGRARQYDVLVAALHGARRCAVPARGQAAHDRVVGRLDHGVLRGHRRRRHDRHRRRSGSSGPAPSARRGRGPRFASSTTTATGCRPGRDRHGVHVARAGDLRVQGRREKTECQPRADGFFTVGDVGELDDDGYLFLRDRKIDMIISGGVNIYPAEIEGDVPHVPARR